MHILVLGSGGREHALAMKLSESALCTRLFIAPGNPGTAGIGINIPMNVNDFDAIRSICLQEQVDMLVVGPEEPLVRGIYDFFQLDEALRHIHVIGPSAAGAALEGSKAFAKQFMAEMNIPTAAYREFDRSQYKEGITYLQQHKLPVVLKADGLAAGKGVVIAQHHEEALQCFEDMLQNSAFGAAGDKVVVEEFLTGIECSVFVLSDGTHYTILPVAKDYKRIGEGDTGLNTGGMGAVSPVPFADEAFMMKVRERIIEPTVQGLKNRKVVYKGFIFIGLISVDNEPYVIEYNCRMGDPETEVVMLRIENDLVDMLMSLRDEKLHSFSCIEKSQHAATVMLVSHGYPGSYEKGFPITLPALPAGSVMYHAGTTMGEGQLRTHGGRVLAVSTLAPDLESALKQSLQLAEGVQFEGKYFRRDIGWEFLPGNR